ncbi:MAG: GAF domain-containing protein [Methylococcaceae bacterium]|jgi:GAF domain-containing protein
MQPTLQSKTESQRVQKLHEYRILDTQPEPNFDGIVDIAAQICDTPFVLITFVDSDREWYKAKKGIVADEQPRTSGFGAQTLQYGDVLVVAHVEHDSRFEANPLVVSEPYIRFFAGIPIVIPTGEALGALCVLDVAQRELSAEQLEALRILARLVSTPWS